MFATTTYNMVHSNALFFFFMKYSRLDLSFFDLVSNLKRGKDEMRETEKRVGWEFLEGRSS